MFLLLNGYCFQHREEHTTVELSQHEQKHLSLVVEHAFGKGLYINRYLFVIILSK